MVVMTMLCEQNIGELWPFIRTQLLKIEEKNPVSTLPEEVFASWKTNSCVVHAIELDDALVGVVVVVVGGGVDDEHGFAIDLQ